MLNNVILMGRLTADPELKTTNSGTNYCNFTVAVNRNFADKSTGERQADFINCTAWGKTAEFVGKYFSKGKMIIVEGSLRNNNYTDSNGVKHYTYFVNAGKIRFGESKNHTEKSEQPSEIPADISDFVEVLGADEVPF